MLAARLGGRRFGPVAPVTWVLSTVASFGGLSFALLQGWPLWAVGLATVIPWFPVFAFDVARTYFRYQWLALFYLLVVTQSGHFLEHVAQMVQIHLLGLTGADARGIFGTLDVEWVHFLWNTWVLLAIVVLLSRFGGNRWLWLTFVLSLWHEVEHGYIFWTYLTTGLSGTPGLLAQGGALHGGLPLSRPDLHFLYNLIETLPLMIAFLYQVRRNARTIPSVRDRRGRSMARA